ncbi:MAG TPA: aminotransferase class V-fold PLP-dependent enzyme, partial [Gemmatimonadaceae bacterium]|nr:aminotransferase class V-fold PLP-dependent enzyme [Gemmatimonadaceae bacterium]
MPKSKSAPSHKKTKRKSTTSKSGRTADASARSNARTSAADMRPQQFRALGHSLVDSIADFLGRLPDARTAAPLLPDAMRKAVGKKDLPDRGTDIGPVIEKFSRTFFEQSTHNGSPRFFGYITSSAAPISALADMLAAAVNANCGAWALSPVATEIENECIRWLAQFMGLPGKWDGILVSGGNMANIVPFIAARKAKAPWDIRAKGFSDSSSRRMIVYTSAETHGWVKKATDLCGLGTDSIRWIPVDDRLRMRTDELRKQIVADRNAGLYPFLVIGTAGSVGTGAIDPLPEIAKICKEFDLWFHVDGAYGAPAVALDDATADLKGLRLGDSIAMDPHKWLYNSIEAGCVLVRNCDALHDAFGFHTPYYQFDDNEGQEVKNFYDHGPQNTRGFRALKIWLGFQQCGASGYRRMIADDIALANRLHEFVGKEDLLEQGTIGLSICTFRFVPADLRSRAGEPAVADYINALNERLVTAIRLSGEAFVSNARIGERYMIRACIVNFRTTL